MTRRPMQDLPEGAEFIGPDGPTRYQVTKSAANHENGWVEVRNLSHTDEEALKYADPQHVADGGNPRDGFFAYSSPVEVEVVA